MNNLDVSLLLHWQKVPDTLPPDPQGGWFSPNVWLALSDGRVMPGQCLHGESGGAHDWFVIDSDSNSKSLNCVGLGLSVIAWMPFAKPDHPQKQEAAKRITP